MRAIVQHRFGDPADVLAVEEVALPEPGPGQVRLKIVLSPIHNHDLWTARGSYGVVPELPARAGTEAVALVDALGEGVTGLAVGQRVATGGTFGVWAEYVLAPAGGLIPVPEGVPEEVAAQLVAMPFSAISLIDQLGLGEGDWLVQNAANGAVGRLVAQLAAARGLNVVGLVRRSAAVAELAAQGISGVVATDVEGWRDEVLALTGGAAIGVGVDSVGGAASGQVLSLLGDGGSLVVFGAMQSPILQLPVGDIIFRDLTVRGFWGSTVGARMAADKRGALFGELITRISSGALTLPVSATYGLDDIAAAVAANAEPGRVGKVMLRP
ncbi:zinc-binding dehydrogenase [Microbacterium sp. CFBP9034]|uniref:zinc-binding dehydrogenase n=1 Tax=Microbacterium sp. CFBP9034 TaxID=3096540 RepID=UPI002A69EE3A|nr:zinc-binding dehydrogenase [Microbacterium sp. CFBP9034]MDY0908359.1 zinc-binding dehydrogenase [Microbacterium sp. CFBP9034]